MIKQYLLIIFSFISWNHPYFSELCTYLSHTLTLKINSLYYFLRLILFDCEFVSFQVNICPSNGGEIDAITAGNSKFWDQLMHIIKCFDYVRASEGTSCHESDNLSIEVDSVFCKLDNG